MNKFKKYSSFLLSSILFFLESCYLCPDAKAGKLDSYSLQIVSKYFETITDFINLEFVTKKARDNLEKFRYNPIPLSKKTAKFFPNIETLIFNNDTILYVEPQTSGNAESIAKFFKENYGEKINKVIIWTGDPKFLVFFEEEKGVGEIDSYVVSCCDREEISQNPQMTICYKSIFDGMDGTDEARLGLDYTKHEDGRDKSDKEDSDDQSCYMYFPSTTIKSGHKNQPVCVDRFLDMTISMWKGRVWQDKVEIWETTMGWFGDSSNCPPLRIIDFDKISFLGCSSAIYGTNLILLADYYKSKKLPEELYIYGDKKFCCVIDCRFEHLNCDNTDFEILVLDRNMDFEYASFKNCNLPYIFVVGDKNHIDSLIEKLKSSEGFSGKTKIIAAEGKKDLIKKINDLGYHNYDLDNFYKFWS